MQTWRGGAFPSKKARGAPGIGSKGHVVRGTCRPHRPANQDCHTWKEYSRSYPAPSQLDSLNFNEGFLEATKTLVRKFNRV